MKSIKFSILLIFLLFAAVGNSAWAGRVHAHVGIHIGPPMLWPWHYPAPHFYAPNYYAPSYYPHYVAPTVIAVPVSPPVYIEQTPQPSTTQKSANSWYYCNEPDGYYPYVKECPAGWQKVAP